jgi:Tol biopolymer transport system component
VRWDGKDPHLLLAERDLPKDDLPQGYSERRFGDVRWIPGSTTLALNVTVVPTSGDVLPRFEIWTVAVQTGVSQLAIRMEALGQPFFSPDGRRLALLQPGSDRNPEGSLSLYNADGTDGRVVLKFARDASPRNHESQVSWLPDSQSLWVAIPDLANSPDKLNGLALYRIGADGQTNMAGRIPALDTFWSPDGTRLAYTQAVSGSSEIRELWLAKANGTGAQRYAQLRDGQFINWSPDGAYFLYADSGQVYLGQIGQAPQHVGNFVSVFDPHWITANQFLYLHDQGTGWMLASHTVNGPTASLRLLPREVTYDVTRP